MITLVFLAVVISGGNIPIFIAILAIYDVLIAAFIGRKRILSLFKLPQE